ncbi:hypothetical protein MWU59_01660 [Flavobacteriaceae bacterium F08102]|nr:hypothetical protein [Flavobacteriaceae bacterium F08102]
MKTNKRISLTIIALLCLLQVSAQSKYGNEPDKCKLLLSLFHESVKIDEYDDIFNDWRWCFDNCPQASLLIYTDGLKIANHMYETGDKERAAALIDEIYTQRIKLFPQNLGKVYNDWAISLEERGASEEEVFEKLTKGYESDPTGLSAKNLAIFFKYVTEKNKTTDVQKIFDTYDQIVEAVSVKIDEYNKELDVINAKKESGKPLLSSEKRTEKNNSINLRALGQVEIVLDQIINEIATCDRLIPLYKKSLEQFKNDKVWLRRAVNRMFNKGCSDDAFYPVIVEAYVTADPSSQAYIFYADILDKNGETAKALDYRNKAVDLEKDTYKKANLLYSIAGTIKSPVQRREYYNKALAVRPSYGKAYLGIASLYANSANSCGNDEFSKRMVYVAALNKAQMAKTVDPSLTSLANKYIKSYSANMPDKKMVFNSEYKSGSSFTIKCWIGETVKVPTYN